VRAIKSRKNFLFGYILDEIKLFCQKQLKKAIFLKIEKNGHNIKSFYFFLFFRVLRLKLRTQVNFYEKIFY